MDEVVLQIVYQHLYLCFFCVIFLYTLPSKHLVSMTTVGSLYSHIILQKSVVVLGMGPEFVQLTRLKFLLNNFTCLIETYLELQSMHLVSVVVKTCGCHSFILQQPGLYFNKSMCSHRWHHPHSQQFPWYTH